MLNPLGLEPAKSDLIQLVTGLSLLQRSHNMERSPFPSWGGAVKLPAPKNRFATDVVISSDVP